MLKVLVIDDEAPIRHWLEFCVNKAEGYVITGVASNGMEGVERFKEEKPDIVVTDVEMPGVNGLEMLEQMNVIDPNFYAIILTSHEDFSYARKAIELGTAEYILKTEITEASLFNLLQKATKYIQNHHLVNISMHDHDNRTDYLQSVALHKKAFPTTLDEFKKHGIELEEKGLVAFVLWNHDSVLNAQELFGKLKGFSNMIYFSIGFERTAALANIDAQSYYEVMESLPIQCESIIKEKQCFLGISDVVETFAEASNIFNIASARCNMSFYNPKTHVISEGKMESEKLKHSEGYKVSFHKELLKQNYLKAIEVKNDVLQAVLKEQPSNIDGIKKLFLSFVSSLLYFTHEDIDEIEHSVEEATKLIQDSICMEELLYAVNNKFDIFQVKLEKVSSCSVDILQAITYMEEHYQEKISLTSVANEVSFSPEYFSRLFIKETGVNFVVYLNNIRMKNAINMLETTNMKVYEIAEKVGYSSLSYFSTAFKKKVGKNPYEYQTHARKKSKQNNLER